MTNINVLTVGNTEFKKSLEAKPSVRLCFSVLYIKLIILHPETLCHNIKSVFTHFCLMQGKNSQCQMVRLLFIYYISDNCIDLQRI